MASPNTTNPIFWAIVEEVFSEQATGVEQVFYQGTNENGKHKIGVFVYDLDGATASEAGCVIAGLHDKHGFDLVLGDIRVATTARRLPSNCPTCGVPWACCINLSVHQRRARQADARRF
jgi:hypothetical protein